jgi:hypothetical protein
MRHRRAIHRRCRRGERRRPARLALRKSRVELGSHARSPTTGAVKCWATPLSGALGTGDALNIVPRPGCRGSDRPWKWSGKESRWARAMRAPLPWAGVSSAGEATGPASWRQLDQCTLHTRGCRGARQWRGRPLRRKFAYVCGPVRWRGQVLGEPMAAAASVTTARLNDDAGRCSGLVRRCGLHLRRSDHTCARTATQGAQCWGANSSGQLGNNSTTQSPVPSMSPACRARFRLFRSASCAPAPSWQARGQVLGSGYGLVPADVVGLSGVSAIAVKSSYCAISSGGAKCWGSNRVGQVGDGTTIDRGAPVDVVGSHERTGRHRNRSVARLLGLLGWWGHLLGKQRDRADRRCLVAGQARAHNRHGHNGHCVIALGANHSCEVTGTGGVRCWGSNLLGQLGDGTLTNRTTPTDVSGLSSGMVAVSAGGERSCGSVARVG